jgi:putative hemolysin
MIGGRTMSRKHLIGTLLLLIALALVACQTPVAEQPTEEPGMPNPASVYCKEQGGTIEIRSTEDGQYGVCIFPDGSECDEWAFFRGECKPGDSDVAPTPVHVPWYVNDQYGFSLDPSRDFAIEGWDNYVLFKKPDHFLFVGYKWAGEEVEPFRTGMPAGDFEDAGTVTVLGAEIPKEILIYEGKVKNVTYSPFQVGDLQIFVWLDAEVPQSGDYNDVDIPAEVQAEADGIVASLALTSGETPEVIILGGE